MRYTARRHYTHPVLTPDNDDYPGAELTVALSDPEEREGAISFRVHFDLDQPYLAQEVAAGRASCKVMIYCRDTLFRCDFVAAAGEVDIAVCIPADDLFGEVRVNPFIVSAEAMQLSLDAVHNEYREQGTRLAAGKRQPLAAARPQVFVVATLSHNQDALFIFEQDAENKLPPGQYELQADIGERQIVIRVNTDDFDRLMTLRGAPTLALSSVYMSALVEAFCVVKYAEEEDADAAPAAGWYRYLKSRQEEGKSPFALAQSVFEQPFQKLIMSLSP